MCEKLNRKDFHEAIDTTLSGLQADPWLAQRVLYAERNAKVIINKRTLVLIIVLFIVLLFTVAVAAVLLQHQHIEQAMDYAKTRGSFSDYSISEKVSLVRAMEAAGISIPGNVREIIHSGVSFDTKSEKIITDYVTEIYGDEEDIDHFIIASHDWGDPFNWTLEQKHWFWETLRDKGLYNGKIKYLLPEDNDLTREQVVVYGRQALLNLYHLPEATVNAFDADVTFFTIVNSEDQPRWRIYFGHSGAESADYTVLLKRDGTVTEDPSLYIFLPEVDNKYSFSVATDDNSTPEILTPSQQRLKYTKNVYIEQGELYYHYLEKCPAIKTLVVKTEINDHLINSFYPCPYCVLNSEFWSIDEKINFGVTNVDYPSEDMISSQEALTIAQTYLQNSSMNELEDLVPSLHFSKENGKYYYTVFFSRLEKGQINPKLSVVIDALSGKVIDVLESRGAG